MDLCILIEQRIIVRKIILIFRYTEPHDSVSGFLELRRDDIAELSHVHGEGHQRRRNIDLVECTGHTVLASDGRQAESQLCRVCSEECRDRLAPCGRLLRHPAEIFLEGKADL